MARSSVTRFEPASSRRNDGDGTDYSDYYIRLFILAVLGVFYALTFRIPDRTAELQQREVELTKDLGQMESRAIGLAQSNQQLTANNYYLLTNLAMLYQELSVIEPLARAVRLQDDPDFQALKRETNMNPDAQWRARFDARLQRRRAADGADPEGHRSLRQLLAVNLIQRAVGAPDAAPLPGGHASTASRIEGMKLEPGDLFEAGETVTPQFDKRRAQVEQILANLSGFQPRKDPDAEANQIGEVKPGAYFVRPNKTLLTNILRNNQAQPDPAAEVTAEQPEAGPQAGVPPTQQPSAALEPPPALGKIHVRVGYFGSDTEVVEIPRQRYTPQQQNDLETYVNTLTINGVSSRGALLNNTMIYIGDPLDEAGNLYLIQTSKTHLRFIDASGKLYLRER